MFILALYIRPKSIDKGSVVIDRMRGRASAMSRWQGDHLFSIKVS